MRPGQLGIVDATHLPPGGPDVNILQAGRPIELFPAKMAPIISKARTEKAQAREGDPFAAALFAFRTARQAASQGDRRRRRPGGPDRQGGGGPAKRRGRNHPPREAPPGRQDAIVGTLAAWHSTRAMPTA